MALDTLARASRGVDTLVTAVVCSPSSPRRRRFAMVALVAFVAAHYRRPRRDDLELVA